MRSKFKVPFLQICRLLPLFIMLFVLANMTGCSSSSDTAAVAMPPNADTSTVETQYGSLRGYAAAGAWIYKGVPFAKPPVGELRWRAPQDPDSWTGVRDATKAASVCTQINRTPQWVPTGPVTDPDTFIGSEDCLYLDIYRPKNDATDLPVFVWIHGGGWVLGGATSYDGAALAARENVIVVVPQYRIGPMGNFSNSALASGENAVDASGNYRYLDEIQALKWVQRNIADFGGDASKVTIGGQSAGGVDVYYLMLSPLTTGLFSHAMSMSASFGGWANVPPSNTLSNYTIDWLLLDDGTVESDGTATWPRYSATDWTNAATYPATMSSTAIKQYLRVKSDYKIQLATAEANFHMNNYAAGTEGVPVRFPILDGTVLPAVDGYSAIASGNYRHVPLLQGKTANDVPANTPIDLVSQAFMNASAANKIYNCLFTWKGGGDPAVATFAANVGAPHAADVPFWFGNMDPATPTAYSAQSYTTANRPGRILLSNAMMDYLGSFIKTGNPNPSSSSLPQWPLWSPGSPDFIVLDATMTALNLEVRNGPVAP